MRTRLLRFIAIAPFFVVATRLQAEGFTAEELASPVSNRSGDFFRHGAAVSTFTKPIALEDKAEMEYFPRQDRDYYEFNIDEELPPADPQKLAEEKIKELPPAERIAAKYGDPKVDTPVLAVDNAPKPFKAIMESLQEGQDELAYQYAKQYVRYLNNIKNRTYRVGSMTRFAMQKEGLIEHGAQNSAPQFIEDQVLYQSDIRKELEQQMNDENLDEATRAKASALFKAAEQEDANIQGASKVIPPKAADSVGSGK